MPSSAAPSACGETGQSVDESCDRTTVPSTAATDQRPAYLMHGLPSNLSADQAQPARRADIINDARRRLQQTIYRGSPARVDDRPGFWEELSEGRSAATASRGTPARAAR